MTGRKRHKLTGVGDLSTGGEGRGSTQPSGYTPPKQGLNRRPFPKILPRLTPPPLWAPQVTQTQNGAKNENGIFGISASRGFRKVIICYVFGVDKKIHRFQCSNKFSAPSGQFILTN